MTHSNNKPTQIALICNDTRLIFNNPRYFNLERVRKPFSTSYYTLAVKDLSTYLANNDDILAKVTRINEAYRQERPIVTLTVQTEVFSMVIPKINPNFWLHYFAQRRKSDNDNWLGRLELKVWFDFNEDESEAE